MRGTLQWAKWAQNPVLWREGSIAVVQTEQEGPDLSWQGLRGGGSDRTRQPIRLGGRGVGRVQHNYKVPALGDNGNKSISMSCLLAVTKSN